MKNLKTIIGLALVALALSTQAATLEHGSGAFDQTPGTLEAVPADTNAPPLFSGPAATAFAFLSAGSNWMATTYGIYDEGSKSAGVGVAALYGISQYAGAGLRLDYVGGKLWMPSGNFQLQLPVKLFGKYTAIPFAFTGIATPLSGKGKDNGSPVGIFGAGLAVRITERIDLLGDYEKWTGFNGNQIRFGILYKF